MYPNPYSFSNEEIEEEAQKNLTVLKSLKSKNREIPYDLLLKSIEIALRTLEDKKMDEVRPTTDNFLNSLPKGEQVSSGYTGFDCHGKPIPSEETIKKLCKNIKNPGIPTQFEVCYKCSKETGCTPVILGEEGAVFLCKSCLEIEKNL